MSAEVEAVLLTGGLGSGKTTVATHVADLLQAQSVPVAAIDLDWLAWVYAPTVVGDEVHKLLCRNLAAILPGYFELGVRRVVMARAVLGASDVPALAVALADVPLHVVRLTVAPAEAERRLRSRDCGTALDEHLQELHTFEALVAGAAPAAAEVRTDNRTPIEIAREILGLIGW